MLLEHNDDIGEALGRLKMWCLAAPGHSLRQGHQGYSVHAKSCNFSQLLGVTPGNNGDNMNEVLEAQLSLLPPLCEFDSETPLLDGSLDVNAHNASILGESLDANESLDDEIESGVSSNNSGLESKSDWDLDASDSGGGSGPESSSEDTSEASVSESVVMVVGGGGGGGQMPVRGVRVLKRKPSIPAMPEDVVACSASSACVEEPAMAGRRLLRRRSSASANGEL